MVLSVGDVEFDGPFSKLSELEDSPGVFVVLCYKDMAFKFLDVRKAKFVQTEVANAIAQNSWAVADDGRLRIAVCYSSDAMEMDIIKHHVLAAESN